MVAELIMGPQSKHDGGRGGAKDGEGWKVDGWVRWLEGLRGMYERRMNRMCDILENGRFMLKEGKPLTREVSGWTYVSKTRMYDFDWPRAGMFVWIKLDYETHPLWGTVDGAKLARALWVFLTTKPFRVLACPGQIFSPTPEIAEAEGWKYFRLCFAAVSEEEVGSCSARFVEGVQTFWDIKSKNELDGIETLIDANQEGLADLGMNWAC